MERPGEEKAPGKRKSARGRNHGDNNKVFVETIIIPERQQNSKGETQFMENKRLSTKTLT